MISDEALGLLASLQESPLFRLTLDQIVADQRALYIDSMRGHVQAGDLGRAQQAEGGLRAFEDLPGIFAAYAKKFKPNRI